MATCRRICRIRVLAENLPFLANSSTRQNGLFGKLVGLAKFAHIANLFCSDSPDSLTFAKPFCEDSPDSRKASLVSLSRIQRIWRVWRIQRVQARPFYTYKICYLCIKRPILLEPTFIKRLGKYLPDLPTFANLFCSDSINSPTFANLFCSDSPNSPTFAKGHFWKNETRIRHIRRSNSPFSRIWGEWPLLSQDTLVPEVLSNEIGLV